MLIAVAASIECLIKALRVRVRWECRDVAAWHNAAGLLLLRYTWLL